MSFGDTIGLFDAADTYTQVDDVVVQSPEAAPEVEEEKVEEELFDPTGAPIVMPFGNIPA